MLNGQDRHDGTSTRLIADNPKFAGYEPGVRCNWWKPSRMREGYGTVATGYEPGGTFTTTSNRKRKRPFNGTFLPPSPTWPTSAHHAHPHIIRTRNLKYNDPNISKMQRTVNFGSLATVQELLARVAAGHYFAPE